MIPFNYVVIRYVHDNASGESLNVGVVLVAEGIGFIDCKLDYNVDRLASAFRGFQPEHHKKILHQLETHVKRLRVSYHLGANNLPPLQNAKAQILSVWPDAGLNYQTSHLKVGSANFLEAALDSLFDVFVTNQTPPLRTDEDVWEGIAKKLPDPISSKLLPFNLETELFTFRFHHTLQNGKLHVVEPISFDLSEAEGIRDKSLRWVGYAQYLKPYVGSLRLVVGGPEHEEVLPTYKSALQILSKSVQVYEAEDSARLTADLERLIS